MSKRCRKKLILKNPETEPKQIVLGSDTLSTMASLKLFLVLAFTHCVLSEKLIKKHCDSGSDDYVTCVQDILQNYFREHSGGVPEKNLKALDPITIPDVVINDDKLGLMIIYKDVKVTGFKDVILSDLQIDTKGGRVEFNLKFDIDAEGDVSTTLKQGKTFSGTFKYEGSLKAETKYVYTEKKVNNEQSIYLIGADNIDCEATNVKAIYNKEFNEAFEKDPDTKTITAEFKDEDFAKKYDENILCKIGTVVFEEAVDVLRTLGKLGD